MRTSDWEIRLCENPDCGLRYPVEKDHPTGRRCPLCLGATKMVLSYSAAPESEKQLIPSFQFPVSGLLDNIRSSWNVGSIFRTSEGFGTHHLYLTGITATPNTADLTKTALGAEKYVAWTYHRNAVTLAKQLKQEGCLLWALETRPGARPLSHIENCLGFSLNSKGLILVVGSERAGVDPGLLELCHEIFFIPMCGIKNSYNVSVAYAIALGSIRMIGGEEINK